MVIQTREEIIQVFDAYRKEIDESNDRRERIIKVLPAHRFGDVASTSHILEPALKRNHDAVKAYHFLTSSRGYREVS
jgi:hypothetical protein